MLNAKQMVRETLEHADVRINGTRPWDIQVRDNRFYRNLVTRGSIGLGESYMKGWWDACKLDEFFDRVIGADLYKKVRVTPAIIILVAYSAILNKQKKNRAFEVGQRHYDIGNDLYRAMLDSRMVYTCGYWKNAKNLDQAQEDKLDLVCRKIGLKEGMSVLDIGCGWGSFLKFAAEKYGAKGVGVTVSKEQAKLAREMCANLPIEIKIQDYRDVKGVYDRVVSLGMIEHVGYRNYGKFMRVAHRCLSDDGLFLLHTIGNNKSVLMTDPWIEKYIFPNGMIPSIKQLAKSMEELFVMEDWHNFGAYYDKTLMAWFENFNNHWHELKDKYEDRVNGTFYRMWKYYLLVCAGSFRARKNNLWQIVLSKKGVRGGYESIR